MSANENQHIGIRGYLGVFAFLFAATVLTYYIALQNLDGMFFPGANTLVALGIAVIKMSFVILFFMHVRWQSRLIWLAVVSGFFWMAIMFAYTLQDYLTRSPFGY